MLNCQPAVHFAKSATERAGIPFARAQPSHVHSTVFPSALLQQPITRSLYHAVFDQSMSNGRMRMDKIR